MPRAIRRAVYRPPGNCQTELRRGMTSPLSARRIDNVPSFLLRSLGALTLAAALAGPACAPLGAGSSVGVPRRQRGMNVTGPWLTFHGAARQMGDLGDVASRFGLIAIDADP